MERSCVVFIPHPLLARLAGDRDSPVASRSCIDLRSIPHQSAGGNEVCRCIMTGAYQDQISWHAKYGFVPIEGPAGGHNGCFSISPRLGRHCGV
jgi:hypothetical protein